MAPREDHRSHTEPLVQHDGVVVATGALGFWNNVPLEEQREPGPQVVVPPRKRPGYKAPGLLDAPAAEMGLMLFLTMIAIVMERVAILWITLDR